MIKQDEKQLLEAMQTHSISGIRIPDLVRDLGMHEKRAMYIMEKWAGRGLYDYGIHVMGGWLTPEGKEAVL